MVNQIALSYKPQLTNLIYYRIACLLHIYLLKNALLEGSFWLPNATRLCALNRETLKAVFKTVMGILPDAETLRGQGYPAFAVEKGSLICTRHTLID